MTSTSTADVPQGRAKHRIFLYIPTRQSYEARRVWTFASQGIKHLRQMDRQHAQQKAAPPSQHHNTNRRSKQQSKTRVPGPHQDEEQLTSAQTMVAMKDLVMAGFESRAAPHMVPPLPLQSVPEV